MVPVRGVPCAAHTIVPHSINAAVAVTLYIRILLENVEGSAVINAQSWLYFQKKKPRPDRAGLPNQELRATVVSASGNQVPPRIEIIGSMGMPDPWLRAGALCSSVGNSAMAWSCAGLAA
jgi:hypothetical protein